MFVMSLKVNGSGSSVFSAMDDNYRGKGIGPSDISSEGTKWETTMAISAVSATTGMDSTLKVQAAQEKAAQGKAAQTQNAVAADGTKPAGGPPPGGGAKPAGGSKPAAASGSSTTTNNGKIYDVRDTNKDGKVSAEEAAQYALKHPEAATKKQPTTPAYTVQGKAAGNQTGGSSFSLVA